MCGSLVCESVRLILHQSIAQQQQQPFVLPTQQDFPPALDNDELSHVNSAQPTFPVHSQGFGAVVQQPVSLPTSAQRIEADFPRRNSQNSFADLPRLRPVFGVPLEELLARDDCSIPIVVCQCVQAVDLYGLDVEGIYRLSGEKKHVDRIKAMFDNGLCCVRLIKKYS
jgi:hypothetical protein